MFRALLFGCAMLGAAIIPVPAQAGNVCVSASVTGSVNHTVGPYCQATGFTVTCHTPGGGFQGELWVSATVCVPKPLVP